MIQRVLRSSRLLEEGSFYSILVAEQSANGEEKSVVAAFLPSISLRVNRTRILIGCSVAAGSCSAACRVRARGRGKRCPRFRGQEREPRGCSARRDHWDR